MPKRTRQEAAVVDGAEPPDLSTWLTYKAVAEANKVSTDMELDRYRARFESMSAAQKLGVGHLRNVTRERDLLDISHKHQVSVIAELRKELKKRKDQTARAVKILLLQ
jgi:hypothetical protein